MRNDINILIAGGDMRQVHCAARLAERYSTAITGFDSGALPSAVRPLADPLPAADSYDFAVLPMLALGEGGEVSAPFYSGTLAAETVASAVRDGGTIFTGRGDSRLSELFPRHRLISYLGREELQLRNAVLTAEGTHLHFVSGLRRQACDFKRVGGRIDNHPFRFGCTRFKDVDVVHIETELIGAVIMSYGHIDLISYVRT